MEHIETAAYLVLCCLLIVYALMDVLTRQIWWPAAAAAGGAGFLVHIVWPGLSALQSLGGMTFGLALVLIAAATGGRMIGMGDGITLTACGAWLGVYGTWRLLLTALCLAAIWAVILLIRGKKRTAQFPFMPFLLAAEICQWIAVRN